MVTGPAGFAADFVAALASDFAEHGADAISALRRRDPNAYLRICASVLPREEAASDPLESLTDEQLVARIEAIADRLADAGVHPRLPDAGAARRPQPPGALPALD